MVTPDTDCSAISFSLVNNAFRLLLLHAGQGTVDRERFVVELDTRSTSLIGLVL